MSILLQSAFNGFSSFYAPEFWRGFMASATYSVCNWDSLGSHFYAQSS